VSVHAVSWVLKHSEARLGDRLVLLALAEHAHGDGSNAYAAVETLAHEARLSERQAQRCLRNLERDGAITPTGVASKGQVVYRLNMGRQIVTPTKSHPDKSGVEGVTNPAEIVSDLSPEPKEEPTTEPEKTSSSFVATPEARRLTELLVNTVNSRGLSGKKVTVTNKSIDAIDKMNRIDGVPWDQIEAMIEWLDRGNHREAMFWRGNVRSGVKLREHFATIVERVKGQQVEQGRRRDGMTEDEHRAAVLAGAEAVERGIPIR
jgi:hypothetical protein